MDENNGVEESVEYELYEPVNDEEFMGDQPLDVEYLEEIIEEDVGEGDEYNDAYSLQAHTLVVHREIDETNGVEEHFYHCMQCEIDFETKDDFLEAHQQQPIIEQVFEGENADTENVDHLVIEDDKPEQPGWELLNDNEMIVPDEYKAVVKEDHLSDNESVTYAIQIDHMDNVIEEEIVESKPNIVHRDVAQYYCFQCKAKFDNATSMQKHKCTAINKDGGDDDDPIKVISLEPKDDYMRKCVCSKHSAKDNGGNIIYQCGSCPRNFECLETLKKHFDMHIIKQQQQQQQSKQANTQTRTIASTKFTITPGCSTCPVCNTEFTNMKNLKLHMRIHNERPVRSIQEALPSGAHMAYNKRDHFYCEMCNKSFDKSLLELHKSMHQNNRERHVCGICNRQFDNIASYEMHKQLHKDKPIPNSSMAIASAAGKGSKRQPKAKSEHLLNAKRVFPCQYCGHEFWRPYEKVKHERVHTGEKPYACEVCGKTFRVSYSLTLHLRTHTNIRPYVCATCNKRFKSQPVYVHHLRIHEAERNYACDECGKTFRTSVQLNGHKNSHNKPFNCPECNRPFSSLFAVRSHMKTHNRDMESGGSNVVENHTQNQKHSCKFCGAVYRRFYALRCHIREKHEEMLGAEIQELQDNDIIIRETYNSAPEEEEEDGGEEEMEEDIHVNEITYSEDDKAAAILITAAAAAEHRSMLAARACGSNDEENTMHIVHKQELPDDSDNNSIF